MNEPTPDTPQLGEIRSQLQRVCNALLKSDTCDKYLSLVPRLASRQITSMDAALAAVSNLSDEEHEAAQLDIINIAARRSTWADLDELRFVAVWLLWLWWGSVHGIGMSDWRRSGLLGAVVVSHKLPMEFARDIAMLLHEVNKKPIMPDFEPIATLSTVLLEARNLSQLLSEYLAKIANDESYRDQLLSDTTMAVVADRTVREVVEELCTSEKGLCNQLLVLEAILK